MSLLKWALFFLVLAAIAGLFGFSGFAQGAAEISKGLVPDLPGGICGDRHPRRDCVQDSHLSARRSHHLAAAQSPTGCPEERWPVRAFVRGVE